MNNLLIVLVVVPDGHGRYLIVQERDGTFFLPAGKVEAGENLMTAAVRETAEEAGVAVGLRGLVGFDHYWHRERGKLRFCFAGYQAIQGTPKQKADEHTLGARFATVEEIATLPLRSPEVLDWIRLYESGGLLPMENYAWYGPAGPTWTAALG